MCICVPAPAVIFEASPSPSIISSQKACLLLTLHYIDQISARQPTFIFTSLTCHRFIISAITASSKGLCDAFCTNQLYAKVGGISVLELNTLEREFLSVIDWRLMVSYHQSRISTAFQLSPFPQIGLAPSSPPCSFYISIDSLTSFQTWSNPEVIFASLLLSLPVKF